MRTAAGLLPILLATRHVDSLNGSSRRMTKARKYPRQYARKHGLDMATLAVDDASIEDLMEERSSSNIFDTDAELDQNLFAGTSSIVPPTIDNTPADLTEDVIKPNIFDELPKNLTDGSKAFTFKPTPSPSHLVSSVGSSWSNNFAMTLSLIISRFINVIPYQHCSSRGILQHR